jgi:acetolactate synthase-1/3 small subunit
MEPAVSRITLVTRGDDRVLEQITKQLNKLICVIKVIDFTETSHVERELALIKVTANEKTRSEVMHIVDIFRGKVIDVGPQSYLIEVTGDEEKIAAILELLKPLGIKEIARTGKVAMHRGMQLLTPTAKKGKAA